MKKLLSLVLISLLSLLCATGVFAQTWTFPEGEVEIQAISVTEGMFETLNLAQVDVIGRQDDGRYIVQADGAYYIVDAARIAALANTDILSSIPSQADYQEILRGTKGDEVRALQLKLVDAGFLRTADGDFGGGTAKALSALQASKGLEATGLADVYTQMLLDCALAEPIEITAASGIDQYDRIAQRTAINLQPFKDGGFSFVYDDMTGIGFIANDLSVSWAPEAVADIDQYDFNLEFGFSVAEGDAGNVVIEPVVRCITTASRQFMLQSIILKSGDSHIEIPAGAAKNTIDGNKSVETATTTLDGNALFLLGGCAEASELKIRLNGKYQHFDILADSDKLDSITEFASTAETVFG